MASDPIFEPLLVPSANSLPPTATVTAAAGSTATITILGGSNNWRGQVSIASAGTGQAAGKVAGVVFGVPFAAAPFVILMPVNATAQGVNAAAANPSTTGFDIDAATALTAASTYSYNYLVLQQ